MNSPRILSRAVGTPLLLSGLISLYTQGEWFAESPWEMLGAFAFVISFVFGLAAVATRHWPTVRACALVASFSLSFTLGVFASGRLIFRVNRVIVQRSTERLVLGIEEYRQKHGTYPRELREVSLQEPSLGSAGAAYFRDEDGSFGFVIWDPGIAGQSYRWDSRTRRWVEHFEPGWIF